MSSEKESVMNEVGRVLCTCLAVAAVLVASPAWAGEALPSTVNVVQDCWTTNEALDPDLEKELYTFSSDDDAITIVWKHKILEPCSNYIATVYGTDCTEGKPSLYTLPMRFTQTQVFGPIDPDPATPEQLLSMTIAPGSIPSGRYDWVLLVECDDTDGFIFVDGDIDDECGINMGTTLGGPLIMGPEPNEALDADPGGSPPGRGPGEEGTTRPWCFEVEEPPPPFDLCEPDECATFTPCAGGICFCFELYDSPGTGGCLQDAPCGTDCSVGGDAACVAGEVCVFNTCCGFPNCVPAVCGAEASVELGGKTTNAGGF